MLCLNSVSKDEVTNTMIMCYMMNRTFNFYQMIHNRLCEIFSEHKIDFKFTLFCSDLEPALVKFGKLFDPNQSLSCIFHFHKEKFNSYASKLKNSVIEIENTASIPLISKLKFVSESTRGHDGSFKATRITR